MAKFQIPVEWGDTDKLREWLEEKGYTFVGRTQSDDVSICEISEVITEGQITGLEAQLKAELSPDRRVKVTI
jgi:hypothetical protein